jgi:hypothetical protein
MDAEMTTTTDAIAKEVAHYVQQGLRVVRLYAPAGIEVCSCTKGADCKSPGKHTTGLHWETTTDEDRVFELWGSAKLHNVGVVLGDALRGEGPAVIDIEADSDEGTAELRRLGLDRYPTPTWSSGRGLHRLFLWNPDLPAVQVTKWGGVECRIGGGGRQTQSVLPPSIHTSGRPYRWEDGFALGDVPIAAVPDNVMEAILAAVERDKGGAAGGAGRSRGKSLAIIRAPVGEGSRNESLFAVATLLAKGVPAGDDSMESALLTTLRAVNTTQCRPPMDDGEVVAVFRSAMKYRREQAASHVLLPGVEAVVDGARVEHRPADWQLTIFQGDPTMFELRSESFREFNATASVRVPAEVWGDSRKMMLAMISAFPGLPVNRFPGDFARIWDGTPPQAGSANRPSREAVVGLRVQLEVAAIDAGRRIEVTDPAAHATRRLVGLLVERLDYLAASGNVPCQYRDGDAPSDEEMITELAGLGRAAWIAGRLWFAWDRIWTRIGSLYPIERGDPTKVARALPEIIGRRLEPQRFSWKGSRVVVRGVTEREMETLRGYAAGAATPTT